MSGLVPLNVEGQSVHNSRQVTNGTQTMNKEEKLQWQKRSREVQLKQINPSFVL